MISLPAEAQKNMSFASSIETQRAEPKHPLDPLSATEISVAVAAVKAAEATPHVRNGMRFIEAVLLEPEKHTVALADAHLFPPFPPPLSHNNLPSRRARLVVYNKTSNETTLWVVELSSGGNVISSKAVPDVQPPMDVTEDNECETVVKNYPPFITAMKKRGVVEMNLVMIEPWCVGYHSEAYAPGRRLARPLIFCRTESGCTMENGYARPVEGIHVLVDMQHVEVIEFEDLEVIPIPPADPLRNYEDGSESSHDLKPLQIVQPQGPSFLTDGNGVQWQNWNFRIGFTPREGLVIYSVAYNDCVIGRRPIAHRLSFVEMVVPYGDPNDPHYRKNAFDAGKN